MTTHFPTPTIYLPMLPEYHTDYNTIHSTNAQVLGYNGEVYLNGDGSTAGTIMDKVRHVGYSSSATGRYIYNAATPLTSTSAFAFSMIIKVTDLAANRALLSIEDAGNVYCLVWVATTGEVRFDCGSTGTLPPRATGPWNITARQYYHVYGHYTGSATQLYVNSVKGNDASSPTAPVYNSQAINIWRRYNGTLYGYGSIFGFMGWNADYLNEDEIKDNDRFMREVFARNYV